MIVIHLVTNSEEVWINIDNVNVIVKDQSIGIIGSSRYIVSVGKDTIILDEPSFQNLLEAMRKA